MPETQRPRKPAEAGNPLRDWLEGEPGAVYAVVDGAQDYELVVAAATEHEKTVQSLFRGQTSLELAEVAPYLVPVDVADSFLDKWWQRRGINVGMLICTSADAHDLCEHLRSIFLVEVEGGCPSFFRFYDPRVARIFLPTCSEADAKEFFGPIRMLLVDAEEPDTILRCTPSSEGVHITKQRCARPPRGPSEHEQDL